MKFSRATAPSSEYGERIVEVIIGVDGLVGSLDDCVESVNIVRCVRHCANAPVRLSQAVASRHHAIFQPLLDILNVASLWKKPCEFERIWKSM